MSQGSERDDNSGNNSGFGSLGFPELRLDSLEWSPNPNGVNGNNTLNQNNE